VALARAEMLEIRRAWRLCHAKISTKGELCACATVLPQRGRRTPAAVVANR
jgi:hypothetical protein